MASRVQRTLGLSIAVALFAPVLLLAGSPAADAAADPLRFGINAGSTDHMTNWGLKPDYGTLWVGLWNEKSGWSGTDSALLGLKRQGITPVIHFFYWGNDISNKCLEDGCYSEIHNGWKDRAGWQRLTEALAKHLRDTMGDQPAIIVLESEFNKNGVGDSELLDGYLADKARYLENSYPGARVALGFGNWGQSSWGTFDRAMAASTYAGIQAMRASTKDTTTSYTGVVGSLLTGVKALDAKFGKPVLITDVALSSYPEPKWLDLQRQTIGSLLDRRAEFKQAGAVGVIYRGLWDTPNANTDEYYGLAERHFGLAWAGNHTWKPSMKEWAQAIRAERGDDAPAAQTPSDPVVRQVEDFAIKSGGERISDNTAADDHAWKLSRNGYVEQRVLVPAGDEYALRVRARGHDAGGVDARMVVVLDGAERLRTGVAEGEWQEYGFRTNLAEGAHTIRLRFVNDDSIRGEDRDLILDRLVLQPV